jgi:superfamily II DNA or RNA helicase
MDSSTLPVDFHSLQSELSTSKDFSKGELLYKRRQVTELSVIQSTLSGTVTDPEIGQLNTSIQFLSDDSPHGTCSHCGIELSPREFCSHLIALSLGGRDFLAASQGAVRVIPGNGQEISDAVLEAVHLLLPLHDHHRHSREPGPAVSIAIGADETNLTLNLELDGVKYHPSQHDLVHSGRRPSSRVLDQLLINHIESDGIWDEAINAWSFSSGKAIETIIGLAREYPDLRVLGTNEVLTLASLAVDAELELEWLSSGAELSLFWKLPSGVRLSLSTKPIGNGPYWILIDKTLYPLASYAGRLSVLFPEHSKISVGRNSLGPILEHLLSKEARPQFLIEKNPHEAPLLEIGTPKPTLVISKAPAPFGQSETTAPLLLQASLKFIYPTPKAGEAKVIVPNRELEAGYIRKMQALGFKPDGTNFKISGDWAVELIHRGNEAFGDPWDVDGLEFIKRETKFVTLGLDIKLAEQANGPIDWFEASISLTQNKAKVPLSLLFKNKKFEGDKWVRLDSGAFAQVPGGSLSELRATLGVLDPNFEVSQNIKARVSRAQALSLSRTKSEELKVSLDARLSKLSKSLDDFSSIKTIKAPKGFEGGLRSYQEDGLSWLTFLSELDLGGILADEMGLGKTVQTLAFLLHAKKSKGKTFELKKPALIIAPTSVVMNWMYEARRFTPELKTLLLQGPKRKALFSEIPESDIVISSYALLRNDRFDLERYEFSYLILDEAQNIKNPDAAVTKAAKTLKARRKVALTGTPTENRPLELWSIFDFVMPGYLGTIDYFRNHVEKPMLEIGAEAPMAKMLLKKTKPFILRRKKADVEKQLPPKIESVLHVEMTDSQKGLYVQVLDEVKPKIFDEVEKKGIRGASISILAALLRLRQVCNHPNSISSLKQIEGFESGKFNLLKDLVTEALESGRKILLFSQFLEMLGIIREWLETQGVSYLYLDGSTKERQPLIDKFNTDDTVKLFLISLKAGGTGLNLTAADTVIIYDPWWNPAVENQAVDRAHRIGQTKPVNVYRLVTADSVEQKIMDLKAKKAKLFNALIEGQDGLSTLKLSKTDLEEIFSNPFL